MSNINLPVELPKDAILEFIAIYKKHYQIDLPFEKGKVLAEKFIKVFKIVSQPIPISDKYY
ncbi:hypothetical protein B6D29_00770 [Microgenomates bacterium UTCPR1]|nr:MAG: hypothetical protein B6D29_00770 [Microgenomates bacterium UTCPR1]